MTPRPKLEHAQRIAADAAPPVNTFTGERRLPRTRHPASGVTHQWSLASNAASAAAASAAMSVRARPRSEAASIASIGATKACA